MAMAALTVGLSAPTAASAGLIGDLLNGANNTVNDVRDTVGGLGSGVPAPAPAPAGAPTPQAGTPPAYTPPAHGTVPNGTGTVGVVDLTPEGSEPLPYEEGGGSEDVVAGRSRGAQKPNGHYHGHITIVSLLGTEILGVDTAEGETEHGPLDAVQTGILDAICDGSGDQVCLEVLRADSKTRTKGSRNSFAILDAEIGGPTGITATAGESNGDISQKGGCQTSHSDSTVADAGVATLITADALESSSDSKACRGGTKKQKADSTVVALNDTGLPVPVAGCSDGTPNSEFTPLMPLAGAVCNADDSNGSQTNRPNGVREALDLFVLDLGGNPLLKTSTDAAESSATAPKGGGGPNCPDASNPDCPNGDGNGDGNGGGANGGGGSGNGPGGQGVDNGNGNGGLGNGPSAKAGRADLPFTGADVMSLALIGGGIAAMGLALMGLADRRRKASA